MKLNKIFIVFLLALPIVNAQADEVLSQVANIGQMLIYAILAIFGVIIIAFVAWFSIVRQRIFNYDVDLFYPINKGEIDKFQSEGGQVSKNIYTGAVIKDNRYGNVALMKEYSRGRMTKTKEGAPYFKLMQGKWKNTFLPPVNSRFVIPTTHGRKAVTYFQDPNDGQWKQGTARYEEGDLMVEPTTTQEFIAWGATARDLESRKFQKKSPWDKWAPVASFGIAVVLFLMTVILGYDYLSGFNQQVAGQTNQLMSINEKNADAMSAQASVTDRALRVLEGQGTQVLQPPQERIVSGIEQSPIGGT